MIRFTVDGLPIIDPAWLQDELSDRGDPEDEEEDDDATDPDEHLEADFEDRVSGAPSDEDWSDGPW